MRAKKTTEIVLRYLVTVIDTNNVAEAPAKRAAYTKIVHHLGDAICWVQVCSKDIIADYVAKNNLKFSMISSLHHIKQNANQVDTSVVAHDRTSGLIFTVESDERLGDHHFEIE